MRKGQPRNKERHLPATVKVGHEASPLLNWLKELVDHAFSSSSDLNMSLFTNSQQRRISNALELWDGWECEVCQSCHAIYVSRA